MGLVNISKNVHFTEQAKEGLGLNSRVVVRMCVCFTLNSLAEFEKSFNRI